MATRKSPPFFRPIYPCRLARMVNQVGRPAMFDGNMFLPETGTPIWKMDRSSTRLAVWLPDPLTVAIWILKSLTTRPPVRLATESCRARSVEDMTIPFRQQIIETKDLVKDQRDVSGGDAVGLRWLTQAQAIITCTPKPRESAGLRVGSQTSGDGAPDFVRAAHHGDAGGGEGRDLVGGGALPAGGDCAGMPHPPARRRRPARGEADHPPP